MIRTAIALGALALAACGPAPTTLVDGTFTAAEWTKITALSPLPPVPADPTNQWADNAAAATLGQRLFFEKSYSGALSAQNDGTGGSLGLQGETGKVACASCHMPGSWFDDTRSTPNATSLAADWTGRNTPTLVNSSFYQWYFWDGRKDSQWSQALGPPEAGGEMNSTRLRIAHVIFSKYRADYDAIFTPGLDAALDPSATDAARFPPAGKPGDAAFDGMTAADQKIINTIYANFGKAIAAYERKLVSRGSPFDRYVAGDKTAISASAKKGLKVFGGKAACIACHNTPLLSDNKFYVTGVAQAGPHVPPTDLGRFNGIASVLGDMFNSSGDYSDDKTTGRLTGLAAAEIDKGRFRTKHIRQISQTGPYTHTGAITSLAAMVDFYDQGGQPNGFAGTRDSQIVPLNLTPEEKTNLTAFLETLTGEAIADSLKQDTSAP